jgi:hypothetical protein
VTRRKADQNHLNYCWVEVDGSVVHVSRYAGRTRPKGHCPVCGKPAVLHLGERRPHHYQHKGGVSGCPLSEGETAKHFNAKHHVAEQLRATSALQVSGRCPGDGGDTDCPHRSELLLVQGWRAIEVESTVGSSRADVLVVGETGPTAAIEILVTHSVPQAKAALLAELKVPWIEVAADDALHWDSTEALTAVRSHLGPDPWLCTDHRNSRDQRLRTELLLEEARRATAVRKAREQQEADSKRARQRTVRYMVVDAVSDTNRARYIFRVNVQLNVQRTAQEKVWLSCDQSTSFEKVDYAPEGARTLRSFEEDVLRYMIELISFDYYKRLETPIVGWQQPEVIDPAALASIAEYPPCYRYDIAKQVWDRI